MNAEDKLVGVLSEKSVYITKGFRPESPLASDYLIVGNPHYQSTWAIPISENGKLNPTLLADAKLALKSYGGVDKDLALARLERLTKKSDFDSDVYPPAEKKWHEPLVEEQSDPTVNKPSKPLKTPKTKLAQPVKPLNAEQTVGLKEMSLAELQYLVEKGFRPGSPLASDYLVVDDPKHHSTWSLPVKENGKPNHGLMGGAFAALTKSYRGNKYTGPKKQAALRKLLALYRSEKLEPPKE